MRRADSDHFPFTHARVRTCAAHQEHEHQGSPYPPLSVGPGLAAMISNGFMPAAHHLPNPFGPTPAGSTLATELAGFATRHSSPGVGCGLGQMGNHQSPRTLCGWPVLGADAAREVGWKSRRGGSGSRSPELSMHSSSGTDLAAMESPRSLRHGGSSTDSLTAHYCQVRPCTAESADGFRFSRIRNVSCCKPSSAAPRLPYRDGS